MSANDSAPAKRWRLLLAPFAALLIAALALAAACGGDDSGDDGGDDGNGEPTATEPAGDNGDGSDDGDDNGDDGNGDDNGDDGDDSGSLDDLRNLTGEFGEFSGRVTYDFTTDAEGVQVAGSMTIYSDGDRSRFEYTAEGSTIIGITTPDATYSCTSFGGQGFCFEGEGDETGDDIPFVEDFADPDDLDDQFDDFGDDVEVSRSSEEIAGRDGECYTVTGDLGNDQGSAKYCFDPGDGILLLSSWMSNAGETFEMRATEISGDVSDSDFEPPYELFDLGDLPDLEGLGDMFGEE